MKHLLFYLALATALSIAIPACSDDSNDPVVTPENVENNMKTGTWRIVLFMDSNDDETHHFTGYTFSFDDNDVLTASNGTITHIGVWNVTDSNSQDDSPEDLDFNIFFATPADFQELSEDWGISLQSDDRLELIHSSGGGGGTDILHFEKN